jgi:hypothetical protein
MLSEFCLSCLLVDSKSLLTLDGRLNRKLKEEEMQFQDEGGLLLPPTIEQKVPSTGMLTDYSMAPTLSDS